MPAAAALALTAALFHVLNHSLFKSLLFFGAGAVLHATGERDMERLGGLIHRMPVTGFAFLVGCAGDLGAAAAQRLRLGVADLPGDPAQPAALPQWGLKFLVPGGRRDAGACRRRSRPPASSRRSASLFSAGRARRRPRDAREVDRCSLAAMLALVALCLLAGILPGFVIDALAPVIAGARRRPHAGAGRHPLAVDRADRGEPQLLQRPAACSLFIALAAWLAAVVHPPLGLARAAARRRPGIAASPSRARRRNTPPAASRSRSGACSARWCSGRARASTCRRRATCGRRASRVSCAT